MVTPMNIGCGGDVCAQLAEGRRLEAEIEAKLGALV